MICSVCEKEVKSLVDNKCQKCFADDSIVLMTLDGTIEQLHADLEIRRMIRKVKEDADV